VGSIEAWRERYPDSHTPLRQANAAWAALPLADGTTRGALLWTFDDARAFDARELALMTTISRLCMQALERARLYEAEQAARRDAENARRAAEAANRAKAEFLATMSHELRTPLNAIAGYAELIELGVRGPVTREQTEDLRRIQRSQRHLLGLINQVLSYARVESGRMTYNLGRAPIDETLRIAEALVAPELRAKGLSYGHAACAPELCAYVDADKLQQIVLNLLANAIKFTDPTGTQPGRVELGCEVRGEQVAILVRDTGCGIPRDKLETIFEPFTQVDRSFSSPREGVGLGLAISRDLARGMGGDLLVESTVGVGSLFTVLVPLA
jgi:signal transduction histidine kinase